jgi:hypothetical protein
MATSSGTQGSAKDVAAHRRGREASICVHHCHMYAAFHAGTLTPHTVNPCQPSCLDSPVFPGADWNEYWVSHPNIFGAW